VKRKSTAKAMRGRDKRGEGCRPQVLGADNRASDLLFPGQRSQYSRQIAAASPIRGIVIGMSSVFAAVRKGKKCLILDDYD
jgi:hypothetical protein